jgi:hypothetical protein
MSNGISNHQKCQLLESERLIAEAPHGDTNYANEFRQPTYPELSRQRPANPVQNAGYGFGPRRDMFECLTALARRYAHAGDAPTVRNLDRS